MFSASKDTIAAFDPQLWQALESERLRQHDHIELIASENYASPRVLAAQGSVLTNKYAPARKRTSPCSRRCCIPVMSFSAWRSTAADT